MSDVKFAANGYIPVPSNEGYTPAAPADLPAGDGVQGGYTPTTSEGANPTNVPTPPGAE
jgi:hypothetical protein